MRGLFPYPYRENQEEAIKRIQEEVLDSNICFHAATGYGKTPVILASLLPYTNDDYRIIWSVRTGNETDRPIEELKIINLETKSDFFGLSYRGKRDMCLLAKEKDLGGRPSYSDVSFLCREQGKDCPYRQNLSDVNPDDLANTPLLYSELLELSKNLGVCPYYAQRELLPLADLVSLSYNYVISEGLSWTIRKSIPFQKAFLVVDEAHNIQKACSSLNSDQITLRTLERSQSELEKLEDENIASLLELVQLMKLELEVILENIDDEIRFDMRGFLQNLLIEWGEDPTSFELEVERMITYGTRIRRRQLNEGKRPRSSLHHLGEFWLRVIENLRVEGIAFLARHERDTLVLEVWDMRSAEVLRDRWKKFKSCIFCSGTLKPIRAFAATAGLNRVKSLNIGSFYDSRKITSLITSGLTTKGETLKKEMAQRYVNSLVDFAKTINSNVAAFSSSYRIQNRLLESGLKDKIEGLGMNFYRERQGMDGTIARKMLDEFKRDAHDGAPGFLCATAQGRFAEGTDFPGEELEGIFIVGIPFDRMNTRTKLYLDYNKRLYGKKKGTYYGYIVPALQRASQALGRVLRSREDKGIFICGDQRYGDRRFFRLLPDYIKNNVRSTSYNRLSKDIKPWIEKTS